MVPSKDAFEAPGTTQGSIFPPNMASQIIASIFDTSMLGIAIFDRQQRFIAVNKTLAALHGIPAKDHIGKKLREVVPQASVKAESLIDHVFSAGEGVETEEITAQVPTRNEAGHWTVRFVPIRDGGGPVSQVCTIATESTQQARLIECLRNLMNKLPQVRDRVSWAYLSSQKQALDPSLLAQSAEILEQCVLTIKKFSGLVEALDSISGGENEVESLQLSFRLTEAKLPSGNGHMAHPGAPAIVVPLTPRQVEVLILLAESKCNKEISDKLNITVKTVEAHRGRIMDKLQIHSIGGLVLYAVRNNLVHP